MQPQEDRDFWSMEWDSARAMGAEDPKPALAEMVRMLKPGAAPFAVVIPRKWFSQHRPMYRWLDRQLFRTRYGRRRYATWLKELGCVDVVTECKGLYRSSIIFPLDRDA